ncbi:MAG: family 14 glycosylhydrolase [Methylacidiphilales bacterium]|nr:family 14 glycosylhydrolase [Candidatus Methylacidiphilales bacterium]
MNKAKRINIGGGWTPKYDPQIKKYYARIRATTTESYVKWIDLEIEPGQISFKQFDRSLKQYERYGVKWQPFLICGPWYSVPYWYKESKESHFFRCLEHDKNTGTQSIWNEKFKKATGRFLKLFHDHYKDRENSIDSLLLGISGDYGEAIYPCVGNSEGQYHTHHGFWCNDTYAIGDFRKHFKGKFKSIKALNARWGTSYSHFDQLRPFLKKDAPSRRAMVDMVYWYRGAMLKHAEFWIQEARKLWKTKDIYLCMGGDGSAEEGQHYTAAAKLCAKYRVGIRDTNSRDNIRFLNTYQCSTAVATNYYKTYCGFESSHGSSRKFIVARMFAFIISNAREFHEYSFLTKKDVIKNFCKFRKLMDLSFERRVDTAVFSSEPYANWVQERATAWDIKEFPWGLPPKPHRLFNQLRYHFDYDLVNDSLIRNGILANYKVLIIPGFTIIEDDIIELIRRNVKAGKKVIIYGRNTLETVDEKSISFDHVESHVSLKKLLGSLKESGIRVKAKKDGIFEATDKNNRTLCYDENKDLIYWKRRASN